MLPYNSSLRSVADQRSMKSKLLPAARRTSDCYSQSKFYMCSIIAPHCASPAINADAAIKEFVLPCKQLCHGEFIYWVDGAVAGGKKLVCLLADSSGVVPIYKVIKPTW